MGELINTEELEQILNSLLANINNSIIDMTPAEISLIEDEKEKRDLLLKYKMVNEIFISPLEKLLNVILSKSNKIKYSYDLRNLSIKQKIIILRKALVSMGCNIDNLMAFVPNNIEDVNKIIEAKEKGFPDNMLVDNKTRIKEAEKYLDDELGTVSPKVA